MDVATRKTLEKYRRLVFPSSRFINSSKAESFLEDVESSTKRLKKERDPDYVKHGGIKNCLDYQLEARQSVIDAVRSNNKVLLSMPTGAGKTYTCINILFDLMEQGCKRILWLAPQSILLQQARSEIPLSWFAKERKHGLYIAKSGREFDDHSYAEPVIRFCTLQKLLVDGGVSSHVDVVVVDEAHHLESNQFGKSVKNVLEKDTLCIGLTATPGRNDHDSLAQLVGFFDGELRYPASLGDDPISILRAKQVYSKVNHRLLKEQANSDYDRIVARRKNLSVELAAFSAARLDSIVESILENEDQHSVVFAYSTAHAIVIWLALKCRNYPVGVVGSQFSETQNDQVVGDFRAGKVQCIVNVKYVATGADFPRANAAYFTVPIGSAIFFEQAVGRIVRGTAVGGTAEATIYDFDNNSRKFGSIQSYGRFLHAWT